MKSISTLLILLLSVVSGISKEPSFTISSGYSFQQWSSTTVSENKLRQSTIPLHFSAEVTPKLAFDLNMSYAHTLKVEEEQTLSGINNISLLVTGSPIVNRLQLMAGIRIPSGKSALSIEEVSVAEQLSNENLHFRTNQYSGGTEGLLGVAFATPIGEKLEIGLAASGTARAEYEQSEESSDKYNPSEFLLLNGGVSLAHKQMLWGVDFTGRFSGKEEIAGTVVHQMGTMFISELYYNLKSSKASFDCSAYTFTIGKESRLSGATLVEEVLKSQGLRFGASTSLLLHISPKISTRVLIDMDGQNSNEYDVSHILYEGKKLLLGGGILWTYEPTTSISLSLGGGYHQGSIGEGYALSGGEEIQGIDASFDVTVRLPVKGK